MRFFARMNLDRRLPGSIRGLAGLALAAALALPGAAFGEQNRNHFDTDSLVRAPGFFDLVMLAGPGQARWFVLTDPNPPSAPNRLVQTEGGLPAGSIAAAVRRKATFQDGTASTFVREGAGHAGMVLRMKDEKNFLLVLVDTATGEVVLSKTAGGKASELGRGPGGAFAHPWQKLSVKLDGPDVAVTFADKALFAVKDPKPVAGRAGLASAGPGESSFDEFVLDFQGS